MNERGTKIVIVSGKLDTPGWAYTECLVGRDLGNKKESDEELEESGNVTNAPWVEKLKDSSGRGINAKVWRVRRDLGKSETG
jgi:polynucleotide 5'-hydroxyl-kinase GRC3/NOL9